MLLLGRAGTFDRSCDIQWTVRLTLCDIRARSSFRRAKKKKKEWFPSTIRSSFQSWINLALNDCARYITWSKDITEILADNWRMQQTEARECNNLDNSLFYFDQVRMQMKLMATSISQGSVAEAIEERRLRLPRLFLFCNRSVAS